MPLDISNRTIAALIVMTAAEAIAGYYWLTHVLAAQGNGGLYAFPVVIAGAVLAVGLLIEDSAATLIVAPSAWNPVRGGALAVTEVVVWSQWANIVLAGLWSASGVGPATVVLAALLALQHGVEANLTFGEGPRLRHVVNGLVEATTLTTAWVLLIAGASPVLVLAALATGFTVEHGYRLTDV